MRHVLLVICASVVLSLAACSGGGSDGKPAKTAATSAAPPKVEAGQCFSREVPDQNDVAPDFTSAVPCSQPHVFEVIGTGAVPEKYLAGTTKATRLANRTELATVGKKSSGLAKAYSGEVFGTCSKDYVALVGGARIRPNGLSSTKAAVSLTGRGYSPWLNTASPAQWSSGNRSFVCSVRFYDTLAKTTGEQAPPAVPVTSTSDEQVITQYFASTFPEQLRLCTQHVGKTFVDCAKAHEEEYVFALDIKAVYGRKFLSGADLSSIPSAQFAQVASACASGYRSAGGRLQAGQSFGYRFDTGVSTTKKTLRLSCVLLSKPRATGSTIFTDSGSALSKG